jgi:YHS domain-containing protein
MPGMQMNKSAAAKAKGPVVKCAVTGEVIGAPSAAYASEKYKGKEYYFCCPKCKPLFDAHRAKYIKHGYAIPAAKTSKTAKHKA